MPLGMEDVALVDKDYSYPCVGEGAWLFMLMRLEQLPIPSPL
jgi:hypothetical protein